MHFLVKMMIKTDLFRIPTGLRTNFHANPDFLLNFTDKKINNLKQQCCNLMKSDRKKYANMDSSYLLAFRK